MGVTSQPSDLPTQSFNTIVQNIAAGIQGRANALINFTIGSTLRSIADSYAAIFMWFQALVLQLLTAMRLSTATGLDVDTFTADFMPIIPGSQSAALPGGSPRLGAQFATGQVTFSRFTAGPNAILIPAFTGPYQTPLTGSGEQVQTFDGTQTFGVIADPSYATYDPVQGGFVLPSSVASIIVPIQALVPGFAGNVVAGAITQMVGNVAAGIDQVTNLGALTDGTDSETDSALKTRFAEYILGLSRGDIFGLTFALDSVAPSIQFTLTEDYNPDGSYHPGYFFVVVDDGSGNPAPDFVQSMRNAAESVRPLGIQCDAIPPTILFASVSLNIQIATGFDPGTVEAAVSANIANFINSLGLGNDLEFTMIAGPAYAIAGVVKVTNIQINSESGDAASILASKLSQDGLTAIPYATVKASNVAISSVISVL
jgi:phage-related baseplate assembly protein